MAKIIKIFKTLRNHWKKSTLGSAALVYGVNYGKEKYEIQSLMRDYCKVAETYGDAPLPPSVKPRHLTVILNPAANRRKAKSLFEKYCAPLLYLSGFSVTIIQTESEGQARLLVKDIAKDTDAIIVAGGDGTISETVTGLMRETNGKCNYPIGVLPLGRTNSVALSLLGVDNEGVVSPKTMADAAMNIIKWNMKEMDSLKIDVLQDEGSGKPVYAVGGIKWGPYRDAHSKQDKYWYFGGLRGYAAFIFSGDRTEKVLANVTYTPPCTGCAKCYPFRDDLQSPEPKYRWWHYVVPSLGRKQANTKIDYTKIHNDNCGVSCEKEITTVDFSLTTANIKPNSEGVQVDLGPKDVSLTDFIKEGWRRVDGKIAENIEETFNAQLLEIHPKIESEKEKWLSIDNEDYEVRPIRVTLIPKSVRMFISPS